MANITLFAQAIGKLPKECIRKIIREEKTDKHSKGYDTWSQFISMMFCQFSGCDSVCDISNGLNSANGNSSLSECKKGQWRVPTDILFTACSFWTADDMATHQIPFQDANQMAGFIYHHADMSLYEWHITQQRKGQSSSCIRKHYRWQMRWQ